MRISLILVVAGILLQCIDIPVDAEFMTINIGSDIVAYILMIVGLSRFLKEDNLQFRSCFKIAIAGLIAETILRLSTCLDFKDSTTTVNLILLGLTTYIFMKFVYNFAETLMFQAKFLKTEIQDKNVKGSISVFCVAIVGYYLVLSFYGYLSLYANILLLICGFYYCATMYNIIGTLYPKAPEKTYDE